MPASSSRATIATIASGALLQRSGKVGEPPHQRRCLTLAASASSRELIERPRSAAAASSMKKRTRPPTIGEVDHAALRAGAGVGDGEDRLAPQRQQQPRRIRRRRALDEGEVAAGGAVGRGHAADRDAVAVDQLGGGRLVEHPAERVAADHAELEGRAGAAAWRRPARRHSGRSGAGRRPSPPPRSAARAPAPPPCAASAASARRRRRRLQNRSLAPA